MFRSLTVFLCLCCSAFLWGQNTSSSPYTSYGIGEHGGLDHATFSGIGNNTITYFDSTVSNYFNPSTYNSLGRGQTLFSVGLSSRFSSYSSMGTTAETRVFNMDHLSLTIPFAKYFGMSFGLKPFTRRGYSFSSQQALGTDTVYNVYEGSGTTSEAFYGLSAYLIKEKRHKLSVGGNIGYVFGTVTNERKSSFNSSLDGGIEQKSFRLRSLYYTLAANYQWSIDTLSEHTFTLSGVYEPEQRLKATYNDVIFFSTNVNNASLYLVLLNNEEKGYVTMGANSTIGLRYSFTPKVSAIRPDAKEFQLDVFASYNTRNYERFNADFPSFNTGFGYQNTYSMNFGVQFMPERNVYEKSTRTNFFGKLRYRAGVYSMTLPQLVNGAQVKDFGTTFGFGIPILTQMSLSSLNFGFTYGNRGPGTSGSLSEKYFGINFGITLAPSRVERWFVKRKLD